MIVCPSLPKKYIEDAMKALNTDKQITVEASYVQWLQNHPDEDRLPSMDELKEFNTAKSVAEGEKTFAEKLMELHNGDNRRLRMLAELTSQDIREFSKYIQIMYDSVVDKTMELWRNLENPPQPLTGNIWTDKGIVVEKVTPEAILSKVKEAIRLNASKETLLKEGYPEDAIDAVSSKLLQCVEYFDQLIPYAAAYIKHTQPISVSDVITEDIDTTDEDSKLDESTVLEHWQIEHLETSVFSTLDPITKDVISHILDVYIDENEELADNKNSFGKIQTMDSREVTRVLIDIIGKCTSPIEMIPALQAASENYVWMGQIVDLLTGNNIDLYTFYSSNDFNDTKSLERKAWNLQALFWKDFHKPFLKLGVLTDGGFSIVNEDSAADNVILQEIKSNILIGGESSDFNIFGINGALNIKNYQKTFDILREHNKVYQFLISKNRSDVDAYKNEIETLTKVLNNIGLNVTYTKVQDLFKENNDSKINKLKSILFNGIFNERQSNNSALQGLIKNPEQSVFSAFYQHYKDLTTMFYNQLHKDEHRVYIDVDRERKTLYSNVIPNSIITMFEKMHQSPEQIRKFIENEFLYDFHYRWNNGTIPNVWLRELYEGNPSHNLKVEPVQLVSSYETSYLREEETQSALTRLETFAKSRKVLGNNTEYALYSVGTFADAKASYYIRNKVRPVEECINEIANFLITDIDRIELLKARKKAIKRTHSNEESEVESASAMTNKTEAVERVAEARRNTVYEIENFDDKDYLLIFPKLAPRTQEILDELKSMSPIKRQERCKEIVVSMISESFNEYKAKLETSGISFGSSSQDVVDRLSNFSSKENFQNDLYLFYVNQTLANLCIDNLFCIDYAYFKNTVDVQKRRKMFYSPTQTAYTCLYLSDNDGNINRINTNISTDDQGTPIEYFILLADNNSVSPTKTQIVNALKSRIGTYLTEQQCNSILEGLDDINVSDGQALRMLKSWRNIMNMLGQGQDERTQRAIEKLLNGTWDYEAYQVAFNVWKPFVSSYMKIDTGVTTEDLQSEDVSRYSSIKVPTMHKNSEFLMLAMYPQIQGIVKQSPKLRAINRFLSDFNIDKAQFTSANKVGNQGAINLNNEIRGTYENSDFLDANGTSIFVKNVSVSNTGTLTINGTKVKPELNKIYIDKEGKTYMASSKGKVQEVNLKTLIFIDENTGDAYRYKSESGYSKVNYEQYIYNQLCLACGLNPQQPHGITFKQGYNTNVIHYEPLNDWGIITNLPEHLLEHETGGLGTQTIKILPENTPETATVKFLLNGEEASMSGKEAIDIFQQLLVDYVQRAFARVNSTFNNPVKLRDYIKKSLAAQTRVSEDLESCLEINEVTGQFKISPLNPIRNAQFLAFCMSLVRKEMIRRNVKQGLLPQVSNYGLEDSLLLRYQDKDGHMIFTQKEFTGNAKVDPRQVEWLKEMQNKYATFREYSHSADGQGNSILYMEAAAPIYDNALYKFVDKESGHFDYTAFEKAVTPEAREAFGYRTPTEAKHSMIPIYIKDFLPAQNSSCIMMAMDWVFLSGSDFDSDKLFTMLPELEVTIAGGTKEILKVRPKDFLLSDNGETLHDRIINSIGHNDLSRNNNLLLWLMRGLLQIPENLSQVLTPNGFSTLERSVKLVEVAENPLVKIIRNGTNDLDSLKISSSKFDEVLKLDNKTLEKLALNSSKMLSPADPTLRVTEQIQNMVGLQIVAINAVFRVFTPLLQKTNSYVKYETIEDSYSPLDHIPFTLNDNSSITDRSLSRVKNIDGRFITDLVSEILGASVDNAKNPLLGKYGATMELVPYLMYLLNRGYNLDEISFFFKQPAIRDVLRDYATNGGDKTLNDCISDKILSYKINESQMTQIFQKSKLSIGDLAYCINSNARGIKDGYVDEMQYVVLKMLKKLMPAVQELNDIAKYCRNSTFAGAASSFEEELFTRRLGYEYTLSTYSEQDAPIQGLASLLGGNVDAFEDALREDVVLRANTLFSKISPLFNDYVADLIQDYQFEYNNNRLLKEEEIRQIKKFVVSYKFADTYLDPETSPYAQLLTKFNAFYKTMTKEGINTEDMTKQSVGIILFRGVPRLVGILKKNDILTDELEIMSQLNLSNGKDTQYLSILVPKGNKNNPDIAEAFKGAWRDLYDKYDTEQTFTVNGESVSFTNKEIADLLWLYNLASTGIYPHYNNFINLFPSNYESLIPRYGTLCDNLQYSESDFRPVLEAYIENNLSTASAVRKVNFASLQKVLRTQEGFEVLPSQIRISRDSDGKLMYPFGGAKSNYYTYLDVTDNNGLHAYYKATEYPDNVVYNRIAPKGVSNVFNEYFGETTAVGSNQKMLEVTPQAASLVKQRLSETPSIEETNNSLSQLFGDNVEASLINLDQVSAKSTDETGMKICVTIKR